jgi:hypothetical protein
MLLEIQTCQAVIGDPPLDPEKDHATVNASAKGVQDECQKGALGASASAPMVRTLTVEGSLSPTSDTIEIWKR